MLQPRELLATLAARHYSGLTNHQLQLLGCLEFGYTTTEIGKALGITPGAVRNEIAALSSRILEPVGLPPHRELLRKWTGHHYACCTLAVVQKVQNDQLFNRTDHLSGGKAV